MPLSPLLQLLCLGDVRAISARTGVEATGNHCQCGRWAPTLTWGYHLRRNGMAEFVFPFACDTHVPVFASMG
jgi:hypothetical protein